MTASASWPGPIILGGDFNHDLTSLPSWTLMEANGWRESRTFSPIDPLQLPPTYCKRNSHGTILASSSRDFILLCPKMCRLRPCMSIWEYSGLPDHNPIVLQIDIPCKSGATRQWKLPRNLRPNQAAILRQFVATPVDTKV